MRPLAILFYALGAVAAVWWFANFASANTHLRWFVTLDGLVQSGLFVAVLLVLQGIRQFGAHAFEPRILIEVIVSLMLFASSVYLHMFPMWSAVLGGLHILFVAAIAALAIYPRVGG